MKILLCAVALTASLVSAPTWAAFDTYLKINGVDGESTSKGHEKWIDIDSWSWGLANTSSSSGGGGSVGRAVFEDFSWMQGIDASVVPLFLGVATGKHYADATLDVVKTGGAASSSFFQMIFKDVTLSSLHTDGNAATLQAAGALRYESVELRYRPQDAKGGSGSWIEGEFSLKNNTLQFSGDPQVIQGLFAAGGNVSLAALPPAVPEPASALLMLAGLAATGAAARRGRRS